MYIKKLNYFNVGPIKKVMIESSFDSQGNPKPIIIVGQNGSGKSIFISNIVDALHEMAGKSFNNVLTPYYNNGHQYFKIISPMQININEKFLSCYISFFDNKEYNYIFKCGEMSIEKFKEINNLPANKTLRFNQKSDKSVDVSEEDSRRIFGENVICYFGPDRYEKPSWMGDSYYNNNINEDIHLSMKNIFSGNLENPIIVKNITTRNLNWLLDVIVDSRADLRQTGNGFEITNHSVNDIIQLGNARKNLEKVMSNILGQNVFFSLNYRNANSQRFNICDLESKKVIVPSLDSLSTGQLALFNMFATIIRYADNNDINKSINLHDIKGIVIIDEVELHLHTDLQRHILPKLIKLFPKIQFVISTHSPLFLLGMEEYYGEEKFEVFQMPDAVKINVENFSEFDKAYNMLKLTQKYQKDLLEELNKNIGRNLIVTEGATDWKHMLAAYKNISKIDEYKETFANMDFEFLQYEPTNVTGANIHLEMGATQLLAMCQNMSKISQPRKLIFIADRDDESINKKFSIEGEKYKSWGNNVYSILLPIPKHRENTPYICIEHYYTDDEIKTPLQIEGVERRLFIGNEFDRRGIHLSKKYVCEKKSFCGSDKINIIEGAQKEKVTNVDNENINVALSKMNFANAILSGISGFSEFSFDAFIELFKIIKEILEK